MAGKSTKASGATAVVSFRMPEEAANLLEAITVDYGTRTGKLWTKSQILQLMLEKEARHRGLIGGKVKPR